MFEMTAKIAIRTAIALLVLSYPAISAAQAVGKSDYYPLEVGTEWVHDFAGKTFLTKVVKHERKGDVMSARVETFLDGKVIASEHLRITDGAIQRVAFSDLVSSAPTDVVKLPPKAGRLWTNDREIDGVKVAGVWVCKSTEDVVKTPAGEFKAVLISSVAFVATDDGASEKVETSTWYAKGVGPVKVQIKQGDNETVILTVSKFTAAK